MTDNPSNLGNYVTADNRGGKVNDDIGRSSTPDAISDEPGERH